VEELSAIAQVVQVVEVPVGQHLVERTFKQRVGRDPGRKWTIKGGGRTTWGTKGDKVGDMVGGSTEGLRGEDGVHRAAVKIKLMEHSRGQAGKKPVNTTSIDELPSSRPREVRVVPATYISIPIKKVIPKKSKGTGKMSMGLGSKVKNTFIHRGKIEITTNNIMTIISIDLAMMNLPREVLLMLMAIIRDNMDIGDAKGPFRPKQPNAHDASFHR